LVGQAFTQRGFPRTRRAIYGDMLWKIHLGAFHLSYKVVRPPKVTGYAWGDRFRQAIGEQAEN